MGILTWKPVPESVFCGDGGIKDAYEREIFPLRLLLRSQFGKDVDVKMFWSPEPFGDVCYFWPEVRLLVREREVCQGTLMGIIYGILDALDKLLPELEGGNSRVESGGLPENS